MPSASSLPRFVIHVGPFKTGTTSIQKALHQCSAELLTRGIYYPPSIPGAHFPLQHADVAFLLDRRRYADAKNYLAEKFAEAEDKDASLILLSSEAFYGLKHIDDFSRLLDQTAVHGETEVIYVGRSISDRLRSNMMEHIFGNLSPIACHFRDIGSLIQSMLKYMRSRDEYFQHLGATIIPYDSLDKESFPADFVEKATGLRCDFLNNEQQNRTSNKVEKGAFRLLSYPIRLLSGIQEGVPIDSPRCFARASEILGDMEILDAPLQELLQQFDQFLISKIDEVVNRSD